MSRSADPDCSGAMGLFGFERGFRTPRHQVGSHYVLYEPQVFADLVGYIERGEVRPVVITIR